MIRLNIHEVKTHLSRYLDRVIKGERILICRRNVPVAEIRPVITERKSRRPVGLAKGQFQVSSAFFEPLPAEIIASFYAENP
jgi:prevent-host-death family protein